MISNLCLPSKHIGNCQFNGNHFFNKQQCETACGERMDGTRKAHFVNINKNRQLWCFERISFNFGDRCLPREDETNLAKIKYRFDYRDNSCKIFESNKCTLSGNVFNTVDECVADCLPNKFEYQCKDQQSCPSSAKTYTDLKAKCSQVETMKVKCTIRYNTKDGKNNFELEKLKQMVDKIRSSSTGFSKLNSTNVLLFIVILITFLRIKIC